MQMTNLINNTIATIAGAAVTGFFVWVLLLASNFGGFWCEKDYRNCGIAPEWLLYDARAHMHGDLWIRWHRVLCLCFWLQDAR